MEGRGSSGGGCCIARYTHHVLNNTTSTTATYPYYTNDISKMDRIMLRFRPIAPKPTISGPNSAASRVPNDNVKPSVSKRKRKTNNTVNKACNDNSSGSQRRKSRSPDEQKSVSSPNSEESCHVVTLHLLPETPDLSPRENNNNKNYKNNKIGCNNSVPTWLYFGPSDGDQTAHEVVPSTVIVEGVSDAWLNENCMGCTDEERRRRLDEDTCPGFISDSWNRVWWTNDEYRRMVTGDRKEDTWRKGRLVSVRLEMRQKVELPAAKLYAAFTCRVRVQYGSHRMVVPCDAWRMNGGGYAWRLDVKAALSLGL